MQELIRTSDVVIVNAAEAVLAGADIESLIVDDFVAAAFGTLPRRLLVRDRDVARARDLLSEAGFGIELVKWKR